MKGFIKNIKDVLYLFKPYWKYNKSIIILFMIIGAFLPAIATVGSVFFQKSIIDALSSGKSLVYIFEIVVGLSIIIYLPQIINIAFDTLVTALKMEQTEAKIKKDIYLKAVQTDYKYFDDPEFYDNYTWTINERAQRAEDA